MRSCRSERPARGPERDEESSTWERVAREVARS